MTIYAVHAPRSPVRSGPEGGFCCSRPLLAVHCLAVPAHGELLVEDPLTEVALKVPAQSHHVAGLPVHFFEDRIWILCVPILDTKMILKLIVVINLQIFPVAGVKEEVPVRRTMVGRRIRVPLDHGAYGPPPSR